MIPGGESIGLQLNTGVIVTGKYDVKTSSGTISPWNNSDIEVGDKLLEVNNQIVNTIRDLQIVIDSIKKEQVISLKLKRSNYVVYTTSNLIKNESGKLSIGLYVKDEVLGVGTLTFVNPNNNKYAALGHSIVQEEMEKQGLGNISVSSIRGIRKSIPGIPGEKQATLSQYSIGSIEKNSQIGVFGKVNKVQDFIKEPAIKLANINEVEIGKAEIWTVIEASKKEKYEIEIIELKTQNTIGVKGIKIKITDHRLLEKTGGIIQGMSGSPIIQNNKLVGAVSHVVVDSPEYGYGVYAIWMYNIF